MEIDDRARELRELGLERRRQTRSGKLVQFVDSGEEAVDNVHSYWMDHIIVQ